MTSRQAGYVKVLMSISNVCKSHITIVTSSSQLQYCLHSQLKLMPVSRLSHAQNIHKCQARGPAPAPPPPSLHQTQLTCLTLALKVVSSPGPIPPKSIVRSLIQSQSLNQAIFRLSLTLEQIPF